MTRVLLLCFAVFVTQSDSGEPAGDTAVCFPLPHSSNVILGLGVLVMVPVSDGEAVLPCLVGVQGISDSLSSLHRSIGDQYVQYPTDTFQMSWGMEMCRCSII